jgi:hypothetical protein
MKISHSVAPVNSLCRCENRGSPVPGSSRRLPPGESLFELSEICHILVTFREMLYARLRCSAMVCRCWARTSAPLAHLGSNEHRRGRGAPAAGQTAPRCAFSKRGDPTIPLASKVPARAGWRTPDGRAHHRPAQRHPLPATVQAVRLLSRGYGSASRLSRSPSVAASSSRIPAISAASSRSTVPASLRYRDRPRGETNTSTRRRSPRSPRR